MSNVEKDNPTGKMIQGTDLIFVIVCYELFPVISAWGGGQTIYIYKLLISLDVGVSREAKSAYSESGPGCTV